MIVRMSYIWAGIVFIITQQCIVASEADQDIDSSVDEDLEGNE